MIFEPASAEDLRIAERQLGRPVRSVAGVAYRCPSGHPGVLATYPRLDNGTPFPTLYYLTCPNAVLACSRLEASGLMAELNQRLADDAELAAAYQRAHESYLADRAELEAQLAAPVPEVAGVSAGGMPTRVKCLHALLGHSLAKGRGVNPIGDIVVDLVGDFCGSAPVAALDAGTNTIRLYIAEPHADGTLRELLREQRFVMLGEGVDATGQFSSAAIERALAAIDEFGPKLREHGVQRARMVATSASRDAANRDEFFAAVQQRIGVRPELISGDEEAQLSFAGALSGGKDLVAPILVVDSGGGSTEFVIGADDGEVRSQISLDIGSRRIKERYLFDDPPTAAQIEQARSEINRQLDRVNGLADVQTFIGVAGTVTTLAALLLGLKRYDRARVHGSRHDAAAVVELSERLLRLSADEILALGPVEPKRAPVLAAGGLIVAEIAKRVQRPLVASEADILDGVALSIVDH